MARDYARLLSPRSIAVLGGGWAENVIAQCDKIGFDGEVWPVHPTRTEIGGRRCYTSINDLPAPPDAAFVGVNRHATIEVVRALADRGAGGAICFASGWAETGDLDLQAQLVAAAGAMPILGPNCYGVLNMLDGAVIWPDQHGGRACDRGVAILSQSSNIAINLTMQKRGLPVAYVACLGNAAQTGMVELAEVMLADPRVTALGIYAEGIADPVCLAEVAAAARVAGKGIVMLKSGRSDAGAAAAVSHTAALSGGFAASQSYLAQAGIAAATTLAALIETLKILHVHGPLGGRRVVSLSCSGGEAGLVADLADGSALDFAPLSHTQQNALGAVLGEHVALANPLDYQTFIWGDAAKTAEVFTTALRPYDCGVFVIDPPRADICDPASFEPAMDAIASAQDETGKPAFVVASLAENIDEDRARGLMAQGIVSLHGIETALEAVQAAAAPPARSGWQPWAACAEVQTALLDEAAAKEVLRGLGIGVPDGVHSATLEGLVPLAEHLRRPLALKGLGLAHKSEAGAVRLGITDIGSEPVMPGVRGYLAEEMVTDGIAEMILSVRRDPVYGATLLIGFGGVETELIGDTVTCVLPVTADEVQAAVGRLKRAPLLAGYRGRPTADVAAVVDVAMRLQGALVTDAQIVEIEINPLIVGATGAIAADALIQKDTL